MAKLQGAFTLGIAVVIGCANQQAAPEPQTSPPGVDIEYREREDAAEPKTTEDEPEAKSEPKQAKSAKDDESSSPKDSGESKPSAAKKSCEGAKKKDCEVMMGCAWSSDKKCISQ